MNRRTLLITGGASLIILGGISAKVLHSDLRKARSPWTISNDSISDPRLRALAYAVLAPSPHNRQPWLIELKGENRLTLFCDTARLLPETDPYNRQITIGLGAFIELLRMAAAEDGYDLEIDYFPQGEPEPTFDERPVANIRFSKTETIKDPLFAYVMDRRTNRSKFSETPISSLALKALETVMSPQRADLLSYSDDASLVGSIKTLCVDGWNIEIETPRTHHESTRLTRVGEKQINASPDGISLSGPMMEALGLTGQLSEEKMNDKDSQAYKGTRDFYTGLIDTARAFAWITSPDNSRLNQIKSGADWLRLHLVATQHGLAFQPLSQILQEFPEMSEPYAQIHAVLEIEHPRIIQGLFRLGYAASPAPAPRWPLHSRLIEVSA